MSVDSWQSAETQARDLIAQASRGNTAYHRHLADLAEKAVRLTEALATGGEE